jgi:hypothetical protein
MDKVQFVDPPTQYRPIPFWFWNHRLSPDEVERQIREMHEKGVGGFFVHGRFGLETEYLSPEWMNLVRRAVEVAKELGMHVWLYDENPFPSGVGGGLVMRDKRNWCKYLDLVKCTVSGGEYVKLSIPEGRVVAAWAVDLESKVLKIDLSKLIVDRCLQWVSPSGQWEVMVFVERLGEAPFFIYGSEPDYFQRSMMNTWMKITHEAYKKFVGEYFGNGIEGIFTDEPKIHCAYHAHDDPFTTAWFGNLLRVFKESYGYDLAHYLPALFTDFGENPGKVRRDFWRLVSREYQDRFLRRYHEWCRNNHIKLTGHLFLEEGLYANTIYQADFSKNMAHFDIPGTDHLGLATETPYQINVIPPSITRTHGQKIVSSSAHIYGKQRVLSETFGCAGWGLSMANMKWIVDWQYTLGVNMLCPHAFYYSIAGVRKTDAPPSQFYQATWWKYYKHFADYVARLSFILSQGKHKAQIAMLYPITSFQSEWAVGTQGMVDTFIAECYDWYCKNLILHHFDYDLVTEEAIQKAGVSTGKMKITGEEYELLILPPITVIELPTLKKIQEFVRAGGKVLATELLPYANGCQSDDWSLVSKDVVELVHDLFGEEPVLLRQDFERGFKEERGPTFGLTSGCRVGLIRCNRPHLLEPILRDAVESLISPNVRITSEGKECKSVNAICRSTDVGDVWFFANTSDTPLDVQISLRGSGFPECWNLETGDVYRVVEYVTTSDGVELPWHFEPYGSLLLVLSKQETFAKPLQVLAKNLDLLVELPDCWRFRTESPNVLPLENWQLHINAHQDWTDYRYETIVFAHFKPKKVFLVLDDLRPGKHTHESSIDVEVNGVEVSQFIEPEWVFDNNFFKLDISQQFHKGANSIAVTIKHGGWAGHPKLMSAPQYLIGEFSLEKDGDVYKIAPPRLEIQTGSWTEQGYPFYSGTGIYSQTVVIPPIGSGCRVMLQVEDPADMFEVWINGVQAGVRPWPPFLVDISKYIHPGENEVEIRVTNSLANMLRREAKSSGLMGKVRILTAK